MSLLDRAALTCIIQHTNQKDKQGFEYWYHPFRIAEMARFCGLDEECQAIGLLHDTVEDTDLTLIEIYRNFGSRIGDGVDSLTRRNKKNSIIVVEPDGLR